MNQMDCKQAQRVWSRVMAAQTDAQNQTPARSGQTDAQAARPAPTVWEQAPAVITPEQVMELISGEMKDAATYRCLSARMKGCARKTLETLAHEERCHAKQLGAIYFLLTGKKACPPRPEPPCITCNAETLRRQYQMELAARERYESLAPLAGARACTMRELALDECRHAQKIYELLQTCL